MKTLSFKYAFSQLDCTPLIQNRKVEQKVIEFSFGLSRLLKRKVIK